MRRRSFETTCIIVGWDPKQGRRCCTEDGVGVVESRTELSEGLPAFPEHAARCGLVRVQKSSLAMMVDDIVEDGSEV